MTGINFTTRQNDWTNLYYLLSLLQVKLTGINFTTSQIDWNKLSNKSNDWNKLYNKSN